MNKYEKLTPVDYRPYGNLRPVGAYGPGDYTDFSFKLPVSDLSPVSPKINRAVRRFRWGVWKKCLKVVLTFARNL